MEPIAQKTLIVVNKTTGEHQEVVIEIFVPRPTDDGQDYFCLARFNGLENESYDVGGADSLQALFLAGAQLKRRFEVLRKEQYDFFWPDSEFLVESLDYLVE